LPNICRIIGCISISCSSAISSYSLYVIDREQQPGSGDLTDGAEQVRHDGEQPDEGAADDSHLRDVPPP